MYVYTFIKQPTPPTPPTPESVGQVTKTVQVVLVLSKTYIRAYMCIYITTCRTRRNPPLDKICKKMLLECNVCPKRSFAFGNKVAIVDTALLNQRATCASALPIRNTALVSMGTLKKRENEGLESIDRVSIDPRPSTQKVILTKTEKGLHVY